MKYDLMAKRPGEGRRPLNGRDVVHGVRRDRVEEGAFPPSQGHELGHLAGALGIAPRDVAPDGLQDAVDALHEFAHLLALGMISRTCQEIAEALVPGPS
jgi:hypothetical protein